MWRQLSDQAGLLMVGAADGSVRVWRDYTFRGTQRLATAWQVGSPPLSRPATVLYLPLLYAVLGECSEGQAQGHQHIRALHAGWSSYWLLL